MSPAHRRYRMVTARELENRLAPFLKAKLAGSFQSMSPTDSRSRYNPTQADFFQLARRWNDMSASFRSLYQAAIRIPSDFLVYSSPGYSIEIYYTTDATDADRVDTTDTYGFHSQNWRQKSSQPNGIPDYVDEVAWAFDSAYAMEIARFGFPAPPAYTDPLHTSANYKVVISDIRDFWGELYGMTFEGVKLSGTGPGFSTYIEIRNDWSGPLWIDTSVGIDYHSRPLDAVRITAAHEFFHAIQYGMLWRTFDFPLSWLEGSAVLMEECAFPEVNDHLQYAPDFFDNPTVGVLDDYPDYSNGYLLMYLFKFAGNSPGIDFIRDVFFTMRDNESTLAHILVSTSLAYNKTWAQILGDFYAASFFSGPLRGDSSLFLADAPLLPAWSTTNDSLAATSLISKTIAPYTMQHVSLAFRDTHADELEILARISDESSLPLRDSCTFRFIVETKDTSFSLVSPSSLDSNVVGTVLSSWSTYSKVTVLAINASSTLSADAEVCFLSDTVTHPSGSSFSYPAQTDSGSTIRGILSGTARRDLRGTPAIARTSLDNEQRQAALSLNSFVGGAFYDITMPVSWSWNQPLRLSLVETYPGTLSEEDNENFQEFLLYRYDTQEKTWERLATTFQDSTVKSWYCTVEQSGNYGIFSIPPATNAILVFPNPVHVHHPPNENLIVWGKSLLEIRIYGMNGNLVTQAGIEPRRLSSSWSSNTAHSYSWNLSNDSGKPISPGTYLIVIGYVDPLTRGMETKKQKILVLP